MSSMLTNAANSAISRYKTERPDLARQEQKTRVEQDKAIAINKQLQEMIESGKRYLTPERIQSAIYLAIDQEEKNIQSTPCKIDLVRFTEREMNLLSQEDSDLVFNRRSGDFTNPVLKKFVNWIKKQGLQVTIYAPILRWEDEYPVTGDLYIAAVVPKEVVDQARKQAKS